MNRIFSLVVLLTTFSCNEPIKYTYSDTKNSEIQFFFEDNAIFNVYHDLDNGIIEGTFKIKNKLSYCENINHSITQYKWKKIADEMNKKIYIQNDNRNATICVLVLSNDLVGIKIFSIEQY